MKSYTQPFSAISIHEAITVRDFIYFLMKLHVAREIEHVLVYYTGDAWDDRSIYVQIMRSDNAE